MNTFRKIKERMAHASSTLIPPGRKGKRKPLKLLVFGSNGEGRQQADKLGAALQKEVYRIDLSQVVSKYTGETEKNLAGLMKKAERKDWILFLDEADALFGKRTSVNDAHDRYANREINYMLNKLDAWPGEVVMASRSKCIAAKRLPQSFHSIVE